MLEHPIIMSVNSKMIYLMPSRTILLSRLLSSEVSFLRGIV